MISITESRELRIKERIVRQKDLYRLACFVYEQFEKSKSDEEYDYIRYQATADDGTVFSSKSPKIFEDSVVLSKRLTSVDIDLRINNPYLEMRIRLAHGTATYSNYITVTGTHAEVVSGFLSRLADIIDAFPPQSVWARKHRKVWESILAAGIGIVLLRIWGWLLFSSRGASTSTARSTALAQLVEHYPFLGYLLVYGMAWLTGMPIVMLEFRDKVEKLWPSVEFQIGPEHKLIEKRRRIWLAQVITLGVLPLLLSFIYDVLKGLAG